MEKRGKGSGQVILFANGVLVFECSCPAMSIRLLIKETAYLVGAARLMYSHDRVKVKSRPGGCTIDRTKPFFLSSTKAHVSIRWLAFTRADPVVSLFA